MSTPSEYVQELIRADRRRPAEDRLNTLLLEGLNSGESILVDDAFWADLKVEALTNSAPARRRPARNDSVILVSHDWPGCDGGSLEPAVPVARVRSLS